jgi:hypothetical protein
MVSAAAWGGSLRVATAVVVALGEEGSDDCLGLASLAHWSRALPRESRGGEPVQVEGTKLIIVAPWLSRLLGYLQRKVHVSSTHSPIWVMHSKIGYSSK